MKIFLFNISLILIFLFSPRDVFSQDSTILKTFIDIQLSSKHNPIGLTSSKECIHCPNRRLTDNPINHFSVYGTPTLNLDLNEKYTFKLGILLEERGFSFGNFSRSNLVAIPYINFKLMDTIEIAGIKLKHAINGGDMWNEDVNDIIRLYNIDYQGVNAKFGIRNIWLGVTIVADLTKSIGLNIGEIHRFALEYQKPDFQYMLSLSNNIQISIPQGNDFTWSNYFHKTINKFNIKGQLDYKINNKVGNGFASSLVLTYQHKNGRIKNAFRFFDKNYNLGFKNTKVHYLNRQLYPLKNYSRDMAQWAFFTNFQNSSLLNYELLLEQKIHLAKKIYINTKLDCNLIYDLDKRDFWVFPGYDLTLNLHYLKGLKFEIGFTNKHMELYSYYQSSTLSKVPFLSYGFELDLNDIYPSQIKIRD